MLAERSGLGRRFDRSRPGTPRLQFEVITSAEPPDVLDVTSDDSIPSRIDRRFLKLEIALSLVSGIAVFALMLLAVVSVGGRNGFNQPLPGYVDWIEQAMPLIAFMGISHVQRGGAHVRMDVQVGMLRGRALYAVEFVFVLAFLAFMALMVWGSWARFGRSFDFAAPMWSRESSMDVGGKLRRFRTCRQRRLRVADRLRTRLSGAMPAPRRASRRPSLGRRQVVPGPGHQEGQGARCRMEGLRNAGSDVCTL